LSVRSADIEVRKTIRGSFPHIRFSQIAQRILGSRYSLSIVICGDSLARRLNSTFRKKDYPANVLSFALSKDEGEIFLNIKKAAREARALSIKVEKRLAHLFIHGCLHLKGYKHGKNMDSFEKKILKQFSFKY